MTTATLDQAKPAPAPKPGLPPPDQIVSILRRAEQGDNSCLPELRALFDNAPGASGLIETYGSPADWLERRMIGKASAKNLAMKEGMERKLDKLRAELSGTSPSPLERLLVQRVVLCWLSLHVYESHYAGADGMTLKQAEYHQRRIDKAHVRFLSAIKALATIRKLALPALQVNIGTNQVNVSHADG